MNPSTPMQNVRTKSSVAFDKPSPYETGGKQEKARLHKLAKSLRPQVLSLDVSRKCVLCNENFARSRHHLVPVSKSHINPNQHGRIWLCQECHTDVHWYFTNQELAETFWEIPKLKEELAKRRSLFL